MTYTHHIQPIVFNDGSKMNYGRRFPKVFESKEDFETWYRGVTIGLAELDQCLNYCKHFIRTKGNEGNYVRDGKTYPVNGMWCGTQDYGRGESGKFFDWVNENWGDNWYELMDRYK
jgi:hypothetical protein